MYLSVMRGVIRITTKFMDIKKTKDINILSCVAVQTLLPYDIYQHCVRFCSNNSVILPDIKSPIGRKNKIDDDAQNKLNLLLEKDPNAKNLLNVLELELTVMRQDGQRVPTSLRPRDWLQILQMKSYLQRKKFLDFLFILEKKRENHKLLQKEKLLKVDQIREDLQKANQSGKMVYGIGQNFMLRRVVDPTMNMLWNWNCLKAIMYGNKLVIDCSYEKYMKSIEMRSCAKQILESFAINRKHNFPFHIYLCNVNLSGELIEKLHNYIPNLFDEDFPMTVTTKSYLDIFDKPKLVYLTANANITLEKYEPDSVYIIGGFVDKISHLQVSLGKAKEENLRMAKLPLDKYIHFGDGSGKNLTVNQVCAIMLDVQNKNWSEALQHVPRRKLYESRVRSLERKVQKGILLRSENNLNRTQEPNLTLPHNDFTYAARRKLWNKE